MIILTIKPQNLTVGFSILCRLLNAYWYCFLWSLNSKISPSEFQSSASYCTLSDNFSKTIRQPKLTVEVSILAVDSRPAVQASADAGADVAHEVTFTRVLVAGARSHGGLGRHRRYGDVGELAVCSIEVCIIMIWKDYKSLLFKINQYSISHT